MSSSKKHSIWYKKWSFRLWDGKREPFEEKLLKNCTSAELQAKIEYLELQNLLNTSECEALEMYLVKTDPDVLNTRVIDVSWMPYELNAEKRKLGHQVQRIAKPTRKHTTAAKSIISGSMFSVVQRSNVVNKISLSHMITIIKSLFLNFNVDFEKFFKKMTQTCVKIDNSIEGYEAEYLRAQQHVDNYKSEILETAYNKITKRIPSNKYEKFVIKRLTKNTIFISELHLKISNLINEHKKGSAQLSTLKGLLGTVTKTDIIRELQLTHCKHNRELQYFKTDREMKKRIDIIVQHKLDKIRELEKCMSDPDLPSLDGQIKYFRHYVELQNNLQALKEDSDDELFEENETEYDTAMPEEQITKYIEVKKYIEESNKEIKSLTAQHERQILTIKLCCSNIKKYNKFNSSDVRPIRYCPE